MSPDIATNKTIQNAGAIIQGISFANFIIDCILICPDQFRRM